MISAGSRRLPGETGTSLLVLGDGVGVLPGLGRAVGNPHLTIFGCMDQSPEIINFNYQL